MAVPAAFEVPFKLRAVCFEPVCATVLDPDDVVRRVKEGERLWVHIHVHEDGPAVELLQHKFGFHELAVEDALSTNERPSIQTFDNTLFLVATAVEPGAEEDHYEEVGFFVLQNSVVTVSKTTVSALEGTYSSWVRGQFPRNPEPGMLLHALLDAIVDGYFPFLDRVEDMVEDLTDAVYAGDTNQVKSLLTVKRRLLEARRRLTPLRDVINGLLRNPSPVINEGVRRYIQDVFDHTLRLSEILDLNREALASVLDVHLSTVSNNLNQVVKKMTVISTVLMTGALVAGIYGMNFERMPELQWAYGYPFAIGLMVVAGLTVLALFRWKKWI